VGKISVQEKGDVDSSFESAPERPHPLGDLRSGVEGELGAERHDRGDVLDDRSADALAK
jgi:hypothetical protein